MRQSALQRSATDEFKDATLRIIEGALDMLGTTGGRAVVDLAKVSYNLHRSSSALRSSALAVAPYSCLQFQSSRRRRSLASCVSSAALLFPELLPI